MATTVTIQPNGVYYRYESGTWKNANRLWDGDESTAPTNQNGAICLKVDFSWLPAGARITQITERYVVFRNTNSVGGGDLRCSNSATYGPNNWVTVKTFSFENPPDSYKVIKTYTSTVTLTPQESETLLSKTYQYIMLVDPSLSTAYEVYLDVTYDEAASNLYIGPDQASAVYVGSTKADAVYIGTTRVL